jgi:hypothetical protein
MLRLYNKHWNDPAKIMSECTTKVSMGFIPTSKGDFAAHAGLRKEVDLGFQWKFRNYLCGRMAIGDTLTQAFLDEIRKRKERMYLVVYEGTNADNTVHPTEPDLFICRHRSAVMHEELQTVRYSTSMRLEDVWSNSGWNLAVHHSRPRDWITVSANGHCARHVTHAYWRSISTAGREARYSQDHLPSVQEIFLDEITIESSPDVRYSATLDV